MKIIPVDKNNNQEVLEFTKLVNENYPDTAYLLTEESVKGVNQFFWAMVDNEKIGVTGFCPKTPTLVETIKTIVFENHRKKGYGKEISLLVEEHCRSIGVKKIISTIYSTNTLMISIKLKQGYTIEGFHPDHEAPGYDEYSLGKIL